MIEPKRMLGVRVREDTANRLRNIAAARNMSVNELTEQIMVAHLEILESGKTINLDEFTVKVEELIAKHTAIVNSLIQRHTEKILNRANKKFSTVMAMVDRLIFTCFPTKYAEWCQELAKLLKEMEKDEQKQVNQNLNQANASQKQASQGSVIDTQTSPNATLKMTQEEFYNSMKKTPVQ